MFIPERILERVAVRLAADDGGGGENRYDGGDELEDKGEGDESKKSGELPKFSSQLSPERREKYGKFLSENYRDKDINHLVDDVVDLRTRMKRSVVVPDKENPDETEKKAFLAAIGVPESPEGYDLRLERFKDLKGIEEFIEDFRGKAKAWELSGTQARQVAEYLLDIAKTTNARTDEARRHLETTFDERLLNAVGGSEEKKNETFNLFKKFLVRIKDKTVLKTIETSGLLYMESFAMSAAEMMRGLSDAPYIDGKRKAGGSPKGESKKSGVVFNYGEEFNERYGGKEE